MFGPRSTKSYDDETNDVTHAADSASITRNSPPDTSARLAAPMVTPRRVVVESMGGRRVASNEMSSDRKLTVGRGISMAGEIACCDILVVEGKVEAKLTEGKLIEITEAGQFRGSVEIESADIAGRFEGQLVVHGRLTIRSTGKISGSVKYGELDINAGGQIIGEIQVLGGPALQADTRNTKMAPQMISSIEAECDEDIKADKRKSA